MNLGEFSVAELLALHAQTLAELRRRAVVRTANAPVGDYAEWLVARATSGQLADNSQKSWDVRAPEGTLQVKARLVSDPSNRSQRQVSPFRSWDFDAAVFVLFDETYLIRRAASVPAALVRECARESKHVNGYIVFAVDALLDRGEDWTARLEEAAATTAADVTDASAGWRAERTDGPTPNGGAYAIAVLDSKGNVWEITEYDSEGAAIMRTYAGPPEQEFSSLTPRTVTRVDAELEHGEA